MMFSTEALAKKVDIYIISNVAGKKFYGDRKQSLSVMQALKKFIPEDIGRSSEFDINRLKDLEEEMLGNKSKSIIIASGGCGIESLRKIKKSIPTYRKEIISVWTGHHIFSDLESNLRYLDIIALPEYVITEHIRKAAYKSGTVLVGIPVVPSVIENVANFESYLSFPMVSQIPLNDKYLIVFYGGEAVDTRGNNQNITRDEIRNLALYIEAISNKDNLKVVLTSGPRTTRREIDDLRSDLTEEKVDFVFFDFQNGVLAYSPLLYLLRESSDSQALVTGEATFVVDEVLQVHKKPIYVLKASSMSDAHHRHIEYEKCLGNVSVLDASSALYLDNIPDLGSNLSGLRSTGFLIAKAIHPILRG
jgi:hypothetical protein